jgi:predicted nucleic-acid-binding protein
MPAVDTNVLVRLMICDDARQLSKAESLLDSGIWVSHLVLVEAIWMLDSVFSLGARQIADAIEMLLGNGQVAMQEAEVVQRALAHFRRHPALGFTDCMVLEMARRHGHLPLATFDRNLSRLDGAQKL